MEFHQKVLIIGYGAVARSTLPILLRHIDISLHNIMIIDSKDKREDLEIWIEKGVQFFQITLSPENLLRILSEKVQKNDLIIDLSVNIDCSEMLGWCNQNEVLYINASVEIWNPYYEDEVEFPYEKTLHYRHAILQKQVREWSKTTTCIMDHGANPGLISHFAKKGLVDIAQKMIDDKIAKDPEKINALLSEKKFSELAMEIGIKVVHCSELDTQIPIWQKKPDEFINTWSIDGFYEEAIAPAEIGWGTHETSPPLNSYFPPEEPDNELILQNMGMKTWIRSWVPCQEITGMVIRHGEAFGLSDRWTVRRDGISIYRPTVCYVYRPCIGTLESLTELEQNNYELPTTLRILDADQIRSGEDILGALLMGHPYGSWWTGSILSIEEAKVLQPGNNATTIQVGIGIVAAVIWMIENPNAGFCLPDDLPYDYILNFAKPYLGRFYSEPSGWIPKRELETDNQDGDLIPVDSDQVWKFHNYL